MEHIWKIVAIVLLFLIVPRWLWSQKTKPKLARLKCKNEGKEDAALFTLPDLIAYCNKNLPVSLAKEPVVMNADSPELFDFLYVYMPAFIDFALTSGEVDNLREYLLNGGFLHINGKYEMPLALKREMKKVFPEDEWTEISPAHPVFARECKPSLNQSQALGLIKEGRLVVLFTYASDRQKALQAGVSIVSYVLGGN